MKRLPVNDRIKATMQANLGDLPDPNAIAVFETVFATSLPMQKKGSIYNGAVMPHSFLTDLAGVVKPGNTVMLQSMHDTSVLPTGRVFYTELVNGVVRGLFYTTDMAAAANIDNSVITDVSVGVLPQHANCSECGWDFLGPDASFMNFLDQTCANDHVIGTDGVHLNLNGVDSWFETSLVGKGAMPGAKIAARANSVFSQETQSRLAASGIPAAARACFAQHTSEEPMDLKELLARIEAQAAEIAALKATAATVDPLKAELATAATAVTALTAQGVTQTAQIATLTASTVELTTKAVIADSVTVFLKDHAKRALVATAKPSDVISDDPAELVKVIESAKLNLVNMLTAGGTTVAAAALAGTATHYPPPQAFTNRKLA